jgi:hypothetical protein
MLTYKEASAILNEYSDDDILDNLPKIEKELGLGESELYYLGGLLARQFNDKLKRPIYKNKTISVWHCPTKQDIWEYFCKEKRSAKSTI